VFGKKSPNPRLTRQLYFANAVTALAFLLLVAIIVATYIVVEKRSTRVIKRDMDRVVTIQLSYAIFPFYLQESMYSIMTFTKTTNISGLRVRSCSGMSARLLNRVQIQVCRNHCCL
jgi:hypothetical protein